jgi:hypothetical protein
MRYRIGIIFCVICIAMALALATVGIRSYFRCDAIHFATLSIGNAYDGSSHEWWVMSNRGTVRFNANWTQWHYESDPNPFPGNDGPYWSATEVFVNDHLPTSAMRPIQSPNGTARAKGFECLGFGVGQYVFRPSAKAEWAARTHTAAKIPHWFACVLIGGPATYVLWKMLRVQYRRGAGLCPRCGYDLRASKDRCPECGSAIIDRRGDT